MKPPLEDPVRQLGMSPSQEMKQLLRSWFDILRYLRTGSHHERKFKQLQETVSVCPEVSKGEWRPDPQLSDRLLAPFYERGGETWWELLDPPPLKKGDRGGF